MEKARVQLVSREPWYSILLQKCIFSWNETVGTAGVRINLDGNIELIVCRKFFYSLDEGHRVGLLMHEMLHLAMAHLTRGKDLDRRIANIAMDIAINQYIPGDLLPPGALLPAQFKLQPGKMFEEYYIELMQNAQVITVGVGTLDNHDFGNPPPGECMGADGEPIDVEGKGGGALSPEMQAEVMQSILQAVTRECKSVHPGRVPMHIEKILTAMRSKQVDWRQELRRFVGRNMSDHKRSTRTRANRRLRLKAPGYKRDYIPKVILACDQSGSVHDAMAEMLLAEVRSILSAVGEKSEVVFFDTVVQKVEMLGAASVPTKRYAAGGTDFGCAFDYAKTKRPDLLIMLTDGECSMPDKPPFPVFWCVAGNSAWDHLIGPKVRIKESA
jgi:predicted metal-dependent peptidase